MNRAWVKRAALDSMINEANRMFPQETGGVLVGFRSENGEVVINVAVGPGPLAVHSANRFHPDHVWQCVELDRLYSDSDRNWQYVGDWHTHPSGIPEPSWLDRKTLRAIATHSRAFMLAPIMMIGGGDVSSWDWKIHEFVNSRLCGLIVNVTPMELVIFE